MLPKWGDLGRGLGTGNDISGADAMIGSKAMEGSVQEEPKGVGAGPLRRTSVLGRSVGAMHVSNSSKNISIEGSVRNEVIWIGG